MRQIFTLAMAAVTVENGFLLVDEIETGLYYESQTDMWRLVLEVAQQLNVQVLLLPIVGIVYLHFMKP
jgi:ABC-type branched-subunit amino acid transport system ATPase component